MAFDLEDSFQVHAYMMVGFSCDDCDRVLEVHTPHEPVTDAWCMDAARQAREQGWYVPSPREPGAFETTACLCPEHAPTA